IALSVPQFALAAACVVGTPYITMLPASMSKGLSGSLPIAVLRPPVEFPVVTILQLWHARSDADPGTSLLRRVIREVGSTLCPDARYRPQATAADRSGA